MKLGFIGLGKMGSGMAKKLLEDGHEVVVWNRSPEAVERIKYQVSSIEGKKQNNIHDTQYMIQDTKVGKVSSTETIKQLISQLESPRIIWSMLPSGEVTENMLKEISGYVAPDDIVIDGSNAFYKDTQRRYDEFMAKKIKFLGIGVAGGIIGPSEGYDMMAGGDASAYTYVTPVLDSLAKPRAAHGYFGIGGAGHFVKMIHNGIEYGIMQSLAEGFDVLEHAPYKLDLLKVGKVWQKSSLVSGFMLDRAVDVLTNDPHLQNITGEINATGEGEWTIKQAKEEGIPVEMIQLSFDYRKRSKTDTKIQNSFTAKMISALRNAFGGHEVKKK